MATINQVRTNSRSKEVAAWLIAGRYLAVYVLLGPLNSRVVWQRVEGFIDIF